MYIIMYVDVVMHAYRQVSGHIIIISRKVTLHHPRVRRPPRTVADCSQTHDPKRVRDSVQGVSIIIYPSITFL